MIASYRPDGSVMDLNDPLPSDIVWREIAETLGKTARWGGRHEGDPFSVAQHSVLGADALFAETGERLAAAQFLLHDAHEAFIGDIQTPVAKLINLNCFGDFAVVAALEAIKHHYDRRIFAAAGVKLPLRPDVKAMDARMCRAEAIEFYGPAAAAHAPAENLPPVRLPSPLPRLEWPRAAAGWLDRFERYVGDWRGLSDRGRPEARHEVGEGA